MIIAFGLIILALTIGLIFLFTSPSLSPVPYFPTNKKDLALVIEKLEMNNNQIIYDLGAGDGMVLFEAAKWAGHAKLDTKFIGVEINPILVLILLVRCFFHPNKKNIHIVLGDMFKFDYRQFVKNENMENVFYMYISPWYLEKTVNQIRKLDTPVRIVSYMYAIKSLQHLEEKKMGLHQITSYNLPK